MITKLKEFIWKKDKDEINNSHNNHNNKSS